MYFFSVTKCSWWLRLKKNPTILQIWHISFNLNALMPLRPIQMCYKQALMSLFSSRPSWRTCTCAVSAMACQGAVRWRRAGGRSPTSAYWATTWRTSMTAHPRWWWRNTESPGAGWRHYEPSTPSSSTPLRETWSTTKVHLTSASRTRRRAHSAHVTAPATCRHTASRAAISSAAAADTTRGLKGERRSATVSSTGAAMSAVRSVYGSTTYTRANEACGKRRGGKERTKDWKR